MNKDILTKFISRKLGVAGTAIGIIATLPIDPMTKGIIIGVIALGYVIVEGIADIKKSNKIKYTAGDLSVEKPFEKKDKE